MKLKTTTQRQKLSLKEAITEKHKTKHKLTLARLHACNEAKKMMLMMMYVCVCAVLGLGSAALRHGKKYAC